ncbi:MAG TPA: hypothetical protein VFN36_05855, partial [Solirubrobacteraceae bacterium]|nr:hypothetical protein [Solirubrobacteraceae bacterium]
AGGLYPNGETTTYQWRYWPASQPATAALSSPAATLSGPTLRAVATAVCGLTANTTYVYELVAGNPSGSAPSYPSSFTTAVAEAPPTTAAAPVIGGPAVAGQTLTAEATWNNASCDSAPSYEWQESAGSGGPWTSVGTGPAWTLTSADVGRYLRVAVSESNAAGPTQVTSAAVGPVAPTPTVTGSTGSGPTTGSPASGSTPPAVTGPSTAAPAPGTTTATTPTTIPTGTPSTTTRTTVRFFRCARSCRLIPTHGARRYRPGRRDRGRYLKVVTEVRRTSAGRTRRRIVTRWVGPIGSATAGSIGLAVRARIASVLLIRGTTGRPLARVRVIGMRGGRLRLVVSPATAAPVRVWAYRLSGAAVRSGTATLTLRHPLELQEALRPRQTIRLVAVGI